MVDFDKFEKNVKNNYGNQEFPFDEQNWEKAAQLIDASRKGKNRGGIFLLSAVVILCTTGLVYYFAFSDSSGALKNNDIAIKQTSIINDNIEKSTIVTVNTTSEKDTDKEIANGNTISNASNTNTDENSVNSNRKGQTHTKDKTFINEPGSSMKPASTLSENTTQNSTQVSDDKSDVVTNSPSDKATSETKSGNLSGTTPTSKKTTPIKSGAKSATPPVLGNTNNIVENAGKSAISNTNPSGVANTNKEGNFSTTDSSTELTKNSTPKMDSTSTVITVEVKPTESVALESVDSVPSVRKSRADSLAAMLPNGNGVSYATNVKEKHNAKNILYMEVGTTYLLGWAGGGKNEANGFNLLGGINFQHYFTGSVAAQIGIQYSSISNLSNTTHTISTSNYDFGLEKEVTSIRYQKLHYVVAPIKITFNAGDKNIFGIGANVGYLLNSDSKKEKYKTNSSDPNAPKNNFTSTKESGYVEGFNPFDIQVGVSYRRRIYKGLSANAEFFYGLSDTKNNDFFKTNNFDRNSGFKVSLCYDLFKK